MPHVPGLRSPYVKVGRLVYFGRMLDKIRLAAAQQLPADYLANLGEVKHGVFDARCCRFLHVRYEDLKAQVLAGADDTAALAWAERTGGVHSDEECEIWNGFITKRGWRDAGHAILEQRIRESNLTAQPIETMFDYLDFDEGRDPVATRAWETA